MRKKSLFGLLMLGLIMQATASQAQETLTVGFLQTKPKGTVIQVQRKPAGTKIIDGHTAATFKEYLLIDGRRTELPNGESFGGAAGEFVLTSKSEQVSGITQKSLQTYTLKDGALRRQAKLSIDEIQTYQLFGSNGNLLISDEFEGLGYEVSIYSSDLKKISSYRPFGKAGFSSTQSYIDENRAVYIFFPIKKPAENKMVLMENNTGRVLFETSLTGNITNVVLAGDRILVQELVQSGNQLIAYNYQGKEVWRLQQSGGALVPVKNGGRQQVFFLDGEAYRFIDMLTGNPGPITPLSSIASGRMGEDYFLDAAATNKEGEILLLVSGKHNGSSFRHEVFRINASTHPERIQTLSTTEAIVRFNKLSHSVLVTDLSNKIFYSYDK